MPVLTKEMMKKATAKALSQAKNEEKKKTIPSKERREDKSAVLNPHKKPSLNIAYSSTQTNYEASSSMGESTKYAHQRDKQQDRIYIGTLDNLDKLTPKQTLEILLNTNTTMAGVCLSSEAARVEREIEEERKRVEKAMAETKQSVAQRFIAPEGSTAAICIVYNRQIFISNVGDSRAILIKRKKGEKKFTSQRLSVTHSLSDEEEAKRVTDAGGYITLGIGRLNGLVAMTRAFGDNHVGPGLTSEPSIPLPVTIDKNEEAYVVLVSDGITDELSDEDVAQIFNDKKSNDERADGIRQEAEDRETNPQKSDNKAVVIVPVKEGQAVIAGVFDGHGGANVSDLLARRFAPEMQKGINEEAKVELKAEDSKAEEEDLPAGHQPLPQQSQQKSIPHGLNIRNQAFQREMQVRIKKIEDSSLGKKSLRNDKCNILKCIKEYVDLIVKNYDQLEEKPTYLYEIIKEISHRQISELAEFIKETNKAFGAAIQVPILTGTYKQHDRLYDVISERRLFKFFQDITKADSQRLIDRYLKPNSEEYAAQANTANTIPTSSLQP